MTIDSPKTTREQKIWQVVSLIPAGKVATYGQIAELAGIGRGARLVGRTLSKLPQDSRLPWHRVVNAAGKISARAEPDDNHQQRRLESEGLVFLNGKLNLTLYRWQP